MSAHTRITAIFLENLYIFQESLSKYISIMPLAYIYHVICTRVLFVLFWSASFRLYCSSRVNSSDTISHLFDWNRGYLIFFNAQKSRYYEYIQFIKIISIDAHLWCCNWRWTQICCSNIEILTCIAMNIIYPRQAEQAIQCESPFDIWWCILIIS